MNVGDLIGKRRIGHDRQNINSGCNPLFQRIRSGINHSDKTACIRYSGQLAESADVNFASFSVGDSELNGLIRHTLSELVLQLDNDGRFFTILSGTANYEVIRLRLDRQKQALAAGSRQRRHIHVVRAAAIDEDSCNRKGK